MNSGFYTLTRGKTPSEEVQDFKGNALIITFKQSNGILEKYMDSKMVGDGGTKFVKGFNWTVATIDEVREKLPDFNLTYGVDVVILNHDEVMKLLATPEWVVPIEE